MPNRSSPNIPRVAPALESNSELVPAPMVSSEPVQPTEAPNDYEMPANVDDVPINDELDAESSKTDYSEFPQSPFANVQTQSLKDELNGKAKIIEITNNTKTEQTQ